jgi:hypothetical protein
MGRFIESAITKFIKSVDKRFFSSQRKKSTLKGFVTAGGIDLKSQFQNHGK